VVGVERVGFYSEGAKLAGWLKLPDPAGTGPWPVLVDGPGWLGLGHPSPTNEPFHRGFVAAGYAVFTFDYRGFGESEGERGWVKPDQQVVDLLNAIAYVGTRPEVDPGRIGVFGLGGTGGGNAIYAAALDPRVCCVCVQTVVADGADWMRRMRREYEWVAFLDRVDANRRRRVLENQDELVDPREELMVATPERKADAARRPTDVLVGGDFHLGSAESLLRYRPIDVVHRIAPRALLLACIENDVVTPEHHAWALYQRAGAPKKLVRQTGVKHYAAYRENYELLMAQFLDWYGQYLVGERTTTRALATAEEIVVLRDERMKERR
jgi:dipeptidyl aminopeptidase/acylaminoacyl peptidase